MATTRNRSMEEIRAEIEREREQLVRAVTNLRVDLHEVTNVRPLLRKAAIGAGAVAAVVVTVKLIRRVL
jgi:hypothetical protein